MIILRMETILIGCHADSCFYPQYITTYDEWTRFIDRPYDTDSVDIADCVFDHFAFCKRI